MLRVAHKTDFLALVRTSLFASLAALAVATTASGASITFDFVAEAAANEGGAPSFTFSNGGLTVEATGTSAPGVDDDPFQFAYLDDVDNAGDPGGLGVANDLNANMRSDPRRDDNVSEGETLTLVFSERVTLVRIEFNDHGRMFVPPEQVDIGTDGVFASYPLTNVFLIPLTATRFDFRYPDINGAQFYLGAVVVPEPASIVLFALGTLALLRRRAGNARKLLG
jgi:hypothetical protein